MKHISVLVIHRLIQTAFVIFSSFMWSLFPKDLTNQNMFVHLSTLIPLYRNVILSKACVDIYVPHLPVFEIIKHLFSWINTLINYDTIQYVLNFCCFIHRIGIDEKKDF